MNKKLLNITEHFSLYKNDGDLSLIKNLHDYKYYLPYLLLVEQLGMKIQYGGEKTACTIFFNYKDSPFAISLMKSGLLLFGKSNERTTTDLLKTLNKTKKFIYEIYEKTTIEKLLAGNITIRNSSNWLLERYYFNLDHFNKIENGNYKYKKQMIKEVELMYSYINIVDSWFAWIEHACTLLLSVSEYDPNHDIILDFLDLKWTNKYNRIFKPDQNKFYAKAYNQLKPIREKIRNTYTHGGINRKNSEILIHWDGMGAVPYNLTNSDDYQPIKYLSFNYDFRADLDVFENFINEFKNGNMSLKYKLIESGMDIYYSEKQLQKLNKALESKETLYEYLDYECGYQDAVSNFEL